MESQFTLSIGAIVAIVEGVILFVLLMVIWFMSRRNSRSRGARW